MALTEEQIEILSSALVPLFQYLEAEVIRDVARRIKRTMTYTRTAELQALSMLELGYSPAKIRKEAMKILNADPKFRKEVALNTMQYKKDIAKLIQEIENEAFKQNNMIVAKAGDMAWFSDLSVWRKNGKNLKSNSFLNRLVKTFALQTNNEMRNLTRTTGFKSMSGFEPLQKLYRMELDKALVKLCSGAFNRDTILADVVHSLSQSGLRTIDFSSGYSMQLDTAVRVAMRTGFNQMAGKITDENIKQSDVNLVYVSSHWGARDKGVGHQNHKLWQGKVYYIKHIEGETYQDECRRIGQSTIEDLWEITGYSVDGAHESDPLGLHGYNCRHQHHPWFEGSSSLPHKGLEEPTDIEVDGKKYSYYDVTQKMRAMERNIRSLKREKEALKSLGQDTKEISAKILEKTRQYTDFCQKANVNPQKNRLRYENGTSDLTKTEAYREYKQMQE